MKHYREINDLYYPRNTMFQFSEVHFSIQFISLKCVGY